MPNKAVNDTELLSIIAGITLFFLVFAGGLILFVIMYYKRQQGFLREKETSERLFKEELERTQQEIRAELLQNVSDEIHDNLGQIASLIKMYVNMLQTTPESTQKHTELKELTTRLTYDLKSLSLNTHPDYLQKTGLIQAMENDLNRLSYTGIISATFEKKGTLSLLNIPDDHQIIVYRIFQESIQNVVKHAQATTVQLEVSITEQQFQFTLSDNGTGFEIEAFKHGNSSGKSGVLNLYKRARAIQGMLDMQSSSNGTRVIFSLPVNSPIP